MNKKGYIKMNIETIFNNAENKEIAKYILYVGVTNEALVPNSNLFIDKKLTKKADADALKKAFYKGLIIQGIDTETKKETPYTLIPISFADGETLNDEYNSIYCLSGLGSSSTPIRFTSGEFTIG